MPIILTQLQQSVHAILLGNTVQPDWIHSGIPKSALIDTFHVNIDEGTYFLFYFVFLMSEERLVK